VLSLSDVKELYGDDWVGIDVTTRTATTTYAFRSPNIAELKSIEPSTFDGKLTLIYACCLTHSHDELKTLMNKRVGFINEAAAAINTLAKKGISNTVSKLTAELDDLASLAATFHNAVFQGDPQSRVALSMHVAAMLMDIRNLPLWFASIQGTKKEQLDAMSKALPLKAWLLANSKRHEEEAKPIMAPEDVKKYAEIADRVVAGMRAKNKKAAEAKQPGIVRKVQRMPKA
jgi:hypothetical protein